MAIKKGVRNSPATEFKKGRRNSPETEFKKGDVPFNKSKSWDEWLSPEAQAKIRSTQYKKGNMPHTAKPKGTVSRRERFRNGRKEIEWYINIDWKGNRKPHNSLKWYLWEVEHQTDRPKGMVLAMKNGDQEDVRIENLELITRAESLARNNGRVLSRD